jgi:hypothetical protein
MTMLLDDDDAQEDARFAGRLEDGRWLRVTADALEVTTRRGELLATFRLAEVTAVSRGGRDVAITRREADPLAVTLASLDAARELEALLRALRPPDPPRRRWRRS